MNYDYEEFIEFVQYAIKQQSEDILRLRWITNYEREMSFNDFKSKLGIYDDNLSRKKSKKTKEEIIKETQQLYEDYEWGR